MSAPSPSHPSDTKDIARGAFTNFLGVLARSLNFAFYIFLGRIYGAKVTGIFILALATVDVVSKLGILGLDRGILTIGAKKHQEKDETGFYRSVAQALIIGFGATLLMVVGINALAEFIAHRFYQQDELLTPLKTMSIGMFFWMVSAILLFTTRSVRIMKYEVYTKSLVEPLVLMIAAVAFYYISPGISGLSQAFLLSVVAGSVSSIYFFGKTFSFKKLFRQFFKLPGLLEVAKFATPIGFYDLLNLLLQRIDVFMLGRFAPSSQLGVYGIAQSIAFGAKKIRQSFDPILIPVISSRYQEGNHEAIRLHYQNVTRWILILNLAVLGLFVFAAKPALALFGKDFQGGDTALILLTSAVVLNGVLGVSELFILIDRPLINLMNTIGTIIMSIVLNLLLIPRWGMEGAAAAMLISYFVMNVARITEVIVLYRIHPFTMFHLRAVAASAVSLSIASILSFTPPVSDSLLLQFFTGVFYVILYFMLLLIIGPANEEAEVAQRLKLKLSRVFNPGNRSSQERE
jgi:O-antigen/teichoic acid export membrane protein